MALLADGWHMSTHAAALSITVFAYRYARWHIDDPTPIDMQDGTSMIRDLHLGLERSVYWGDSPVQLPWLLLLL